jgi:hypothetical protein
MHANGRCEPSVVYSAQWADMLIIIRYSEMDNLKFLLMCFDAMSGLKINFDKSEAMIVGCKLEDQLRVAHMMNYKLG